MGGGLLISRRAVELARAVQAGNGLGLQGGEQGRGVDALVLDGIGGAHHLCFFKAGNGAQHGQLHILRQTGGEALNIHFLRVHAAGLDKELMALLVGKTDDLRLDAGTITGAHAGDRAVIHGTAVQVLPDDPVGLGVGIGQVAHRPVVKTMFGAERERLDLLISGLEPHLGKINAPAVDPGGRAGLEPAQGQPQPPQIVRKANSGVHAVRAGGLHTLAGDNGAVKKCAGGNDNSLGLILRTQAGGNAGNTAILRLHRDDLGLLQLQIFLPLQGMLHVFLIPAAVSLGPQGMDRRAFAPVEHPVLNAAMVRRNTHLAAQGIQLPHQMSLARAADGRVTGHIAHGVQIDGKQDGVQAQPGGCQRRFDARVSRADHGDLAGACIVSGHRGSSSLAFFSSGGKTKGLHTTSQRLMGVPRAWNFSS